MPGGVDGRCGLGSDHQPEPVHDDVTWVSSYDVNPLEVPVAEKAALLIDWTDRLRAGAAVEQCDTRARPRGEVVGEGVDAAVAEAWLKLIPTTINAKAMRIFIATPLKEIVPFRPGNRVDR